MKFRIERSKAIEITINERGGIEVTDGNYHTSIGWFETDGTFLLNTADPRGLAALEFQIEGKHIKFNNPKGDI